MDFSVSYETQKGNFTANKKSYQFAKCIIHFWYLIPPNGGINDE